MTEKCALFFSIDDEPKFGMVFCEKSSLAEAIAKELWGGVDLTPEDRATISGWAETVIENGSLDFEDGWIAFRDDVEGIAGFLMQKVKDAREDAAYEDKLRFVELERRKEAEAAYASLRDSLRVALGDKEHLIVAKVA